MVLQEIKRNEVDRRFISSLRSSRYKVCILLHSAGRSGGILLIWDVRRVYVKENMVGDFTVSVKIDDCSGDWWFTGLYSPCKASVRGTF